ncbi:hypothetical protein ACTHPH_12630 [Paenibacillus pasadenensis]|uniref:hypothetical protein n=1 Tax=Paenibacillus TaxID=44249 RepID=UPI00129ADA73|nr:MULTISPECIES: hypothetical protein [Paenibacillus]QGG55264.1 hypothetical protein GE073_06510 [Paenibacillus sp. B01]
MNSHQPESSSKSPVKVLDVRQVLEQLGLQPDAALKELFPERTSPPPSEDRQNRTSKK